MRSRIQEYNFVTRKRIRFRFCKFIQQFSDCKVTVHNLQLKYLMSLEMLLPSLYSERFQVTDRKGRKVTIVVTGNSGIQRSTGTEEGALEEVRSRVKSGRRGELLRSCCVCSLLQELQTFCDFSEVIDISVKQANKEGSAESRVVTVTKQDNQILVSSFSFSDEHVVGEGGRLTVLPPAHLICNHRKWGSVCSRRRCRLFPWWTAITGW